MTSSEARGTAAVGIGGGDLIVINVLTPEAKVRIGHGGVAGLKVDDGVARPAREVEQERVEVVATDDGDGDRRAAGDGACDAVSTGLPAGAPRAIAVAIGFPVPTAADVAVAAAAAASCAAAAAAGEEVSSIALLNTTSSSLLSSRCSAQSGIVDAGSARNAAKALAVA